MKHHKRLNECLFDYTGFTRSSMLIWLLQMTYCFEMWIIVEDHLSDMWLWGGFKYLRSWNFQMIYGPADPDITTDFHELCLKCVEYVASISNRC